MEAQKPSPSTDFLSGESNLEEKITVKTNGSCYLCSRKAVSPVGDIPAGFLTSSLAPGEKDERRRGNCELVGLREILQCLQVNPKNYLPGGSSSCYDVRSATFVEVCGYCQILLENTAAAYRQVKDGMQEIHGIMAATAGVSQTLEVTGENCGRNAKEFAALLRNSMEKAARNFPKNVSELRGSLTGTLAVTASSSTGTSAIAPSTGATPDARAPLLSVFNSTIQKKPGTMYECPQCLTPFSHKFHLQCHVYDHHLPQIFASAKFPALTARNFVICCILLQQEIIPTLIIPCGETVCSSVYCRVCHAQQCDVCYCQHHLIRDHFLALHEKLQEMQHNCFIPRGILSTGEIEGPMEYEWGMEEQGSTITRFEALHLRVEGDQEMDNLEGA